METSSRPLRGVDWLVTELGLKSKARGYDLARRGVVPSVRIGKLVKFDPVKIEEITEPAA